MKRCPTCNRTYTDASLNFCLEDGTPLVADAGPGADPHSTVRYTIRDTNPPATEIYPSFPAASAPPASTPPASRPAAPAPPFTPASSPSSQWNPPASIPGGAAPKKSSALWWVIGGALVLAVIVVGAAVMVLVLASMNSNKNGNTNSNSRLANRNTNANANSNSSNINSNANLPALVSDDFSQEKWGKGNFSFGDIWYSNDEYHMRSKEGTYIVMYAPTQEFSTENATVKVTVRSVDGTPSDSGFGLIVHGEKSKSGELEDYALLIYTGEDPQYQIIEHKGGTQSTVVPWVKSSAIRTGTATNQLEVRARGTELSFYVNGQYLDKITDKENFRRGVAGFYSSETTEVAFDDLEIKR